MIEIVGDLWEYHRQGMWAGITTNAIVKRSGDLVMGKGIALQARDQFPGLAAELGKLVLLHGNVPIFLFKHRLFTFPTKHHWKLPSDLMLIERSARFLMTWLNNGRTPIEVCLPRPGCGNGGLSWSKVREILVPILDDRVHITNGVL